ncbi:innexin inx5-like [Contarinia nasturtii]|uniref:innexin inx5-like n=1 Tax=Contarinia nasturtii TaxID=265458 RepID=UPI0012D39211|nr:innexin inx5-like [Contarinia nasturtii]
MYKLVEPLGKLFSVKHFTTSDTIFLINTKFTTALLILFSILLTALDLMRVPIDCYTDGPEARKKMMDNFCWSIGTYTCNDSNYTANNIFGCRSFIDDNKLHQRYYQWISLVFIVQAVLSYIPAYIWKVAECGLLRKLCENLDVSFDRKNWNEKKNNVIAYFNEKLAGRAHAIYTNQYIGVKVLSIVCILINMIMLNMVIPGYWATYWRATTGLITGDTLQWRVNSDLAFPRITKCMFKASGPSGSLQEYDALCLMPLNVVNQKIFVIIWIWYILQLAVSLGNLLYWTVIYYSKSLRIEVLRRHSMLTMSRKQIAKATDHGHLGNFFVLNQIAKNTNSLTFVELLTELSMIKVDENNRNLNGEKSI